MSTDGNSLLNQWLSNQKDNNKEVTTTTNVLSYGEERLYFLQSLQPSNPFYNYAEIYTLSGQWDIERIQKSIEITVKQYEIFSENYRENEYGDLEVFRPERPLYEFEIISKHDYLRQTVEQLEERKLAFARQSFQLSSGPLFSYLLIEKEDNHVELLFVLHHIITDKWSMQNFREKWRKNYQNFVDDSQNNDEQISYRSFASHLRQQEVNKSHLSYWSEKLKDGSEKVVLPFQKPTVAQQSFKGAFYTEQIPRELREKINRFKESQNTTYFSTLLSVFKILLAKYSSSNSISVGTPVSIRDEMKLEPLIGFFNETITIKSDIDQGDSFITVNKKVAYEILESFERKNVPFQKIVSETGLSGNGLENPFFSTMFLFHQKEKTWNFGADRTLDVATYDLKVSKFDFTLYVEENDAKELKVIVEYSNDLFTETAVKSVVRDYLGLIDQLISQPTEPINNCQLSIPKLSNIEQFANIEVNGNTVIEQILEHSTKNPNSIAVSAKGNQITYRELDIKSRQLANHLLEANTKGAVGLLLDRSVNYIVAILGVLRAGLTYMPIDPEYPQDRIDFMVKDSACDTVVSHSSLSSGLSSIQRVVLIDKLSLEDKEINHAQTKGIAYRIYTSGSSGLPKGVNISHQNLWYSNKARELFYTEKPTSFLLLSSFSFDSSVAGIFWTLIHGGNLVISEEKEEQDIQKLLNKIKHHQISHSLLLPSLFSYLLEFSKEDELESLQSVIVAGEACRKELVELHFEKLADTKLYNEYGPTEATVWSIAHQILPEDIIADRIPIGKPIPFVGAKILDEFQNEVPTGIPGELYLAGPLLSSGYHNRDDETKNRFIELDELMYKTGDQVVVNESGIIEFLGRVDNQVKVRGHRIELDEISAKINAIETVREAEVIFDTQQECLIAYYSSPSNTDSSTIRDQLQNELPKYMVPRLFHQLASLPKLPNGKIDQKQLSNIQVQENSNDDLDQPSNDTEEALLAIWKEVLKRENIGVLDNFFSVGGDSLLSIRVNAKAKEKGFDFSTNQIFVHQTIRELATFLQTNTRKEKKIEVLREVGLSPIQDWFFATHKEQPNQWNQIFDIQFTLEINSEHLNQAIQNVINQHQSLRTRFDIERKKQIFEDQGSGQFNQLEQPNQENIARQTKQLSESFDIASGELFTGFWYNSDNQTTLRIIAHHLIFDIISLQNFIEQLKSSIIQLQNGEQLEPSTITQFSSYVNEQKFLIEDYKKEASFWGNQIASEPILATKESDILTQTFVMNEVDTAHLEEANATFNTTTDELLLTAYCMTINEILAEEEITIGMENHGRSSELSDLNLSQSIGWFTSFYPRTFQTSDKTDVKSWIKSMKDQHRRTINSGIGFGFSIQDTDHYKTTYPYVFNYLGASQEQQSELINNVTFISDFARHLNSEVYHKIELNILKFKSKFHLTFRFNQNYFQDPNVFFKSVQSNINQIIETCLQSEEESTASDYDVDGLNQDDLDELMKNFEL